METIVGGAPGRARQSGLTLVELMVALMLFVIVITAIYQTFNFQQEAYMQTEAKVNMVQEARAAQFFLARDIKMAGFDPTTYALTGFDQTAAGQIRFSMDVTGNGDPDDVEISRFALTSDTDTYEDGLCPAGTDCRLSREWCANEADCGGMQPVAEGVEAIEFCYTIGSARTTTAPTALERTRITSVIVSLLMRQTYRSRGYQNTTVYIPAAANTTMTPLFNGDRPEPWGPFNDPYRRKLIIFEVKSRNMGMNPYIDAL
jgi:type IV pilus assembly protein PilW